MVVVFVTILQLGLMQRSPRLAFRLAISDDLLEP